MSTQAEKFLKVALPVVLFLGICQVCTKSPEEVKVSEHETQAAISAIQQRYEPSYRLLALNPDTQGSRWSALKNPAECDYPEHKNCWKVIYRASVMPEAESEDINCEWLVDMDTMQTQPINTEARTMFQQN
jgi:hypothetical protein